MKSYWLSHQLTNETPIYGGTKDFEIIRDKSIANGDSCNTSELKLPSHTGTHVDAPLHFIHNGQCIEDYAPTEWIFKNIQVLTVNVEPGQLISRKHIFLEDDSMTEAILLRTSFERFRNEKKYWNNNPGVSPELAQFFIDACPNLKIIGMDFISISSYKNRETGREAHKKFLTSNLRLIEDMHLNSLPKVKRIISMIVMPLRFYKADGAPCTIVGEL